MTSTADLIADAVRDIARQADEDRARAIEHAYVINQVIDFLTHAVDYLTGDELARAVREVIDDLTWALKD